MKFRSQLAVFQACWLAGQWGPSHRLELNCAGSCSSECSPCISEHSMDMVISLDLSVFHSDTV